MRKTTIEYACDSCGTAVEKMSDLRRFTIAQPRRGRSRGNRTVAIAIDLCGECESDLVSALERFTPTDQLDELREMLRESVV